ncbi:hypothetical protein [Rhizobium lentis]|uniref:hypothetical protein n=1 Tax=Rhizobium lentis TaxID=1138194 RepID=UPI00287F633B|nr:hypothetical protein [Rhizobium lentis]
MHDHSSSEKSKQMPPRSSRRLPIGAEVDAGGVSFRLWAPARERCFLVIGGNSEYEMNAEDDGYFCLNLPGLSEGTRYQFHFGDTDDLLADPASRFQPEGLSGPSAVVDPARYQWNDHDWQGIQAFGAVVLRCISAPSRGRVPLRQPGKSWLNCGRLASPAWR